MLIGSKHSKNRYFHHDDCGYAKQISEKNIISYPQKKRGAKQRLRLRIASLDDFCYEKAIGI